MARWRRCLPVLLCVATTSLPAQTPKEFQVKAAFIYNFTKYVEWPEGHFENGHRPIVIAILGRNPFGGELEKIIQGRKVGGRSLTVRVLASADEAKNADVLFICEGEDKLPEATWQALRDASVLTTGESDDFARHGIITFVVEGDKVRFAVNIAAAERAQLKMDAQLLKLATSVHRIP